MWKTLIYGAFVVSLLPSYASGKSLDRYLFWLEVGSLAYDAYQAISSSSSSSSSSIASCSEVVGCTEYLEQRLDDIDRMRSSATSTEISRERVEELFVSAEIGNAPSQLGNGHAGLSIVQLGTDRDVEIQKFGIFCVRNGICESEAGAASYGVKRIVIKNTCDEELELWVARGNHDTSLAEAFGRHDRTVGGEAIVVSEVFSVSANMPETVLTNGIGNDVGLISANRVLYAAIGRPGGRMHAFGTDTTRVWDLTTNEFSVVGGLYETVNVNGFEYFNLSVSC